MTNDEQVILGAVNASDWFQGVNKADIETIAKAGRIKDYPVGSYVFSLGEITTDIFCVISGRVRIAFSSSTGQEFAMTDVGPGRWLGEPALVIDKPRVLEANVFKEARVLVIPRRAVQPIMETNPIIYKNLFLEHVNRSREIYELFSTMVFHPLRARLAVRVLLLLKEHGIEVEGGTLLNLSLSQTDFAKLTMGSRQRINATFRDWTEQGILTLIDGKYLVKDVPALMAEVEMDDFFTA